MYSLIEGIPIPAQKSKGSAGLDFCSPDTFELRPGEWTSFSSGICFDGNERFYSLFLKDEPDTLSAKYKFQLETWVMMILPRSGLGVKYGLRIKNTCGVIDSSYRDPIQFSITVDKPYTLEKGERFAQGIVVPYGILDGEEPTEERTGGYGSSGRF